MGFMGSLNERKRAASAAVAQLPDQKGMLGASSAMLRCRWLWEEDPVRPSTLCQDWGDMGTRVFSRAGSALGSQL